MTTVGQIERATQDRVIALFRDRLGYDFLGNWGDREGNRNIEVEQLRLFLFNQGHDAALIKRTLHAFGKVADNQTQHLYDRNRAVYELLRYGVKVKTGVGEDTKTVWLVDWKHPEQNLFAIAEEVTVKGADAKAAAKRPDLVLYVNGIALGVLELKRSTVSVSEGIRQNLDNQKKEFIQPFFSTMQLVMAGNDTEGLRYGTIGTPEKYFMAWKDEAADLPSAGEAKLTLLDRHILQLCGKARLLELIHDFTVFDAGIKKLCRHNQYFGVRASQAFIRRREGGIIWHTQGSGKSLTMVWLAKWIREHVTNSRVLIITDRTELDEQIEKVFKGVNEEICRTKSGEDLIGRLNATEPWLICSLVHKFGAGEGAESDVAGYVTELKRALPQDFRAKGDLYVFVDECHRTQSGDLHKAMKMILPGAVFIGFTGTPLLKADRQRSIEVFGRYIHTYKYDEAVKDRVVLDLRYEARDIDQNLTSEEKVDQWFAAKTKGLTAVAKAKLKQRWGTMQRVLSSQSRLQSIVNDLLLDMNTRPRLMDGRGNAMLVAGSIYEACKFYELFAKTELAGKCAIVTSYQPSLTDTKGETTGEGDTDNLQKYGIYQKMLADWFNEPAETAVNKAEEFEKQAKKKFIEEPGQLKLLIVVDKLLTGFDAPPATYLYIDKQMRDHGLFQAICRVNRLDGDDKEYGYIIDYKDLFKSLAAAIKDYTSGALDGYDAADVAGLLKDRLAMGKEHLEAAREAVKALCEPVAPPQNSEAYLHYFCARDSGNAEQLKANEPRRQALYKLTNSLLRAFANMANELKEAGYTEAEIAKLKAEVAHIEKVSDEVGLASGDYIDLKQYEPAMRHLIDTYIQADESERLSAFDDMSLLGLIVEQGAAALDLLPKGIRKNPVAVAEAIENNVRKLIINEQPINPAYYGEMSKLLDALIQQRKLEKISYQQYLEKIVALTRKAKNPGLGGDYPKSLNSHGKRALFDNLGKNEALALAVDAAVRAGKQDDFRNHPVKLKKVKLAIREVLAAQAVADSATAPADGTQVRETTAYGAELDRQAEAVLEIVKRHHEY